MSAVLLTVGLMRGGYVQREALPDIDGDVLEARILMPQGTPLSETRIVVDHATRALKTVNRDLAKDPARSPAARPIDTDPLQPQHQRWGKRARMSRQISVDLLDAETRNTPLDALISAWARENRGSPRSACHHDRRAGLRPPGPRPGNPPRRG